MLRAARELLAVRSPLDAELMVSEILGTWWGQGPAPHEQRSRGRHSATADLEELIGEGLVAYASRQDTPAALALLAGIACLGTSRQAAQAERAALKLMERGVSRPRWADELGKVAPGDCYVNRDTYGDRDELVCVFSYAGEEQHALVASVDYNFRARIRALPPGRPTGMTTCPPLLGSGTHGARRQAWSRDRRAMLAAEFLASDEAEDLSDRQAASRCVDRIIDFGCDQDFRRPLRMSPDKVERFLLDWLPRKVMLSQGQQEAMPHVLAAWTRWAGRRTGLPSEAIRTTLDSVFESMGKFAQTYRDPESFGLDRDLVNRLLPDGDLEALARRTFAFPLLGGRHGGVDLAKLNPADAADRRRLLETGHAAEGQPDSGRHGASRDPRRHIDLHVALADRLWRGEPPELWEAAQRLLDLGTGRHEALHVLMETVTEAGPDEEDIAAALSELPPDT